MCIRGTDENFSVTEELPGMCTIKGRKTEKEISDRIIKYVIKS
jgi:hypothetical protein